MSINFKERFLGKTSIIGKSGLLDAIYATHCPIIKSGTSMTTLPEYSPHQTSHCNAITQITKIQLCQLKRTVKAP